MGTAFVPVLPFSGGGFTGALRLRTSPLAEARRVSHPDGAPIRARS